MLRRRKGEVIKFLPEKGVSKRIKNVPHPDEYVWNVDVAISFWHVVFFVNVVYREYDIWSEMHMDLTC
jgi:hypothetical protein